MDAPTRAFLQSLLATNTSLSPSERNSLQRFLNGENDGPAAVVSADDRLFVSQKRAAQLLDVSRVTIWRMTKECVLHPVEILPGTWRYPYREIAALERSANGTQPAKDGNEKSAA